MIVGGDGLMFLTEHGRLIEAPGYKECFPEEGARTWSLAKYGEKWRPSIHMPRWASRITLEITGVRVEPLIDIDPLDCFAEGIESEVDQAVPKFKQLWKSINGEGSWNSNPWVWVVDFKSV